MAAASPNSFTLDFGDYAEAYYSVRTSEGEQISGVDRWIHWHYPQETVWKASSFDYILAVLKILKSGDKPTTTRQYRKLDRRSHLKV
jgi:hypothetical protein